MGKLISKVYRIGNHELTNVGKQEGPVPFPKTTIRTIGPQGEYIFAPPPELPDPTIVELAGNFGAAMKSWAEAGLPVLTREQYDVRSVICEPCEYWDGAARFGLGKCKAPGCGCTKFKRWLATEQCKHPAGSKWPIISPPK